MPRPRRQSAAPVVCAGLAILVGFSARRAQADAEGELRSRFQGAMVITKTALFSECTDHFTDNKVAPGGAPHGDGLRFASGELAYVDKVNVTWTRIDVSLTFREQYRVTWQDGPFTLYEQRRCRAQLNLDLPREVRKDAQRA